MKNRPLLPQSVSDQNHFVNISVGFRLILVTYVFVFHFIDPVIRHLFYDERPLVELRLLSQVVVSLLIYAPILFYQPKKMGWLHPFILPTVIGLVLSFAKNYSEFLHPFSFMELRDFSYIGLETFSDREIAMTIIKGNLIKLIALLSYYLGFFQFSNIHVPRLLLYIPSCLTLRVAIVGLLGLGTASVIIYQNGGVEATVLGLAGGRFRFREKIGGGHFVALTEILRYAWLLWFAYRPKAIQNPIFWLYVLGSLATVFIVTGSRSSIIIPLIFFGIIYVLHHRSIPVFSILIAGFCGILLVGALGQIRAMGNRSESINLDVLFQTSIKEKIELTNREAESRVSGNMMVLGKAMDQVGPLWGRTYLAGVFFWVPRAIWKNKPRGAGAYAGNILYYNRSLSDNSFGGDALAIPVSAANEAYWNFWYPGVFLVYFLFGLFHKFMTKIFVKNRDHAIIWVFFVLSIAVFEPTTRKIVSLMQGMVIIGFIGVMTQIWRPISIKV